ncbi:MAG: class I SAM-dependent methyltransferase [Yoonia sp.]|uniref:class I SAM-dependent DNA methyltransferase n=1 Tax=Yoonia sp. TaxID=2212373 RepID=UPI0032671160
MSKPPIVKDAYALTSDEAVKELYRDWAVSYDIGFSVSQGYQIPREVALAFFGAEGVGPVLDVGAGTGLVGEQLAALGDVTIDGVDLSAEMLAVAATKGHYRDLIEANILQPLPTQQRYAGIVSAGTFTLGHVGPEGVVALLDVAEQGALFVIAANAEHFESAGFASMLDDIGDRIADLSFKDIRIYDDRASEDHIDDMARLIIFRTV